MDSGSAPELCFSPAMNGWLRPYRSMKGAAGPQIWLPNSSVGSPRPGLAADEARPNERIIGGLAAAGVKL